MYVIRATWPSSPSSTPSYRRWESVIVFLAVNPSLFAASCCSFEVMNGAGALRRRSFLSTLATVKGSFFSSSTSGVVTCSDGSSAFSPSILMSLARNCGGRSAARSASIDQYSTGTKAAISASRSTTRRTATHCTPPAGRAPRPGRRAAGGEPPPDLLPEDGRDLVADEPVEDAPRLLCVVERAV